MERKLKKRKSSADSDDLTEKEIDGLEQQLGLSESQAVSKETEIQRRRERFYTTFESRYRVRIEPIEMGKPGAEITQNLVYYRLADLSTLISESGAQPSGRLWKELRDRDIGNGEINRERAVSALETRGLAEHKDYVGRVIAYATKTSSSK
ncbi:MAG TPA: hypothetical protein VJA23_05970 [Candidatus Nanoarchaeia archaeon]|nr:hypothetical protein [Candidatus Nanoarchaeia archaeon]